MGFNFKEFLSKLQGKKKRDVSKYEDDYIEKEEEELTEDENELEEELFDEEQETYADMPDDDGKNKGREKNKSDKNSKFKIDLKDKKVKLSIAAVGVLVVGAITVPYVTSYMGQKEAESIGNISNITPVAEPNHRQVARPKHSNRNNLHKHRHARYHNMQKKQRNDITNRNIAKRKKRTLNPVHNVAENKKSLTASGVNVAYSNNFNGGTLNGMKVKEVEQALKRTNRQIKQIQQHLVNSKLTGKNDPVGLIDETIMKNRNYDLYLQSQIQLMKKLVTYYKQRTELQKTLRLYKMAFLNDTKGNKVKSTQEKTHQLQQALKSVITPLERQIAILKKQLEDKNKQVRVKKEKTDEFVSFGRVKESLNLSDLNIFVKNGKYIAVIHTSAGDKIYKEGDYFNGYKIKQILPNLIIFEKNGQKFYYSYNQNLNQKYQTAEIALPAKITKSEVKTNKNDKNNKIKEYKPVSRQELLQKLLQQRLKQMGR
jgi:hypothetical protein